MRHGKKFNHLGRTASHRSALLSNMACSLIEHKRINTTVAKAKALRVYVEPILTKAKEDTTHNRRTVFSYLQSKEAVTELFRTVAPKIAERNGGYTRIIKTGFRPGDAADTAMIELVDFNELYNPNAEEKKVTRRSRRSAAPKAEAVAAEVKEAPAKADAKTEEPTAEAADSTEEKTAE
ncbi:50S ribosomal protein L17 [Chryseobacterium manosquense]|uniref:Large ribosomal subunit protein bL17 n=2 Tax=Chryseobacterium group TaxID=2782232 RepID=A0A246BCV8_9FLAO|nr:MULTISPECIES: 50S ribosomal protein L17 [Chryseobacterium group]AZB20933.1 50S ribosomal protein L17 [Kaistella haifensis]OWK99517.1 50S ribosomal protein L17 [Kaistella haifensis DSM 19056]QNS40493.1 50S ribosomal protein L17 [Chryseobacterium manosquense]